MEFRLALLHSMNVSRHRQAMDYWITSRFMDLFYAASIQANLVEKESKAYIDQMGKSRSEIIEMIDPFGPIDADTKAKSEEEQKKKVQEDVDNKLAYIEMLSRNGVFQGTQQLATAISALNHVIEDMKDANTTAD